MEISIKATNLDLTPALKKYAEDKISPLFKFSSGLTHAKIELERTSKHHHKGEIWRAEANLRGTQHLFRAEAMDNDIYAAIDAVKDELKRELHSLKEKRARFVRLGRQAKSTRSRMERK